jgi:glycosyltransferase involved in cell wall biosynthesis
MAVHDDERFVGAAVRSILDQTFVDFEYVIVDDASRDRSREIVGSFADPRLRVIDQPERLGLTRSLNHGLAGARGEYVARFDANDVSRRDRLARQVALLDAQPDVVVVGSRARQVRRSGAVVRRVRTAPPLTPAGIDWALMFYSPLVHPATMFRREPVERLGGYDERFVSAQDFDLWSRLATVGRLANLPEELIDLRVDPSSISGYQNASRRLLMAPLVARAMGANIRRLTRQPSLPDGWPEIWVRLMYLDPHLPAAEAMRAFDLLAETRARFAEVRPESRDSREIADQVAFFGEHAAFHLCGTDRRAALRVFARAAASSLSHAARDLPRFGTRFLLGEAPVRLWRQVAHR